MRRDIRAVRDELHANAVKVTGDGVARLTATAEEAAERGLYVRAEPPSATVRRARSSTTSPRSAGTRRNCAARAPGWS